MTVVRSLAPLGVFVIAFAAKSASASVVINNPAANSIQNPSVHINATNTSGTATFMKVWIDGQTNPGWIQHNGNTYDLTVNLAKGQHTFTVQAGVNGVTVSSVRTTINVAAQAAVVFNTPVDGSTVGTTLAVNADNITGQNSSYMKLWIDHVPSGQIDNTNYFS